MASPSTAAGPIIRNSRNPNATPLPSILHLSFNQEGGSFAVGTPNGFMIFNTDPFERTIRQDLSKNVQGGGVGIVQRISSLNAIVALFCPKKIVILGDVVEQLAWELDFSSEVKSVRLGQDRIVAVTMQKI
ncbi:UNVERIFIED_CONTAM: WD repeat domain phosphoinositide-interacting protein 3 [Sesamum latifolium]|uniref:WD repeat domain phosphoinositide-interacting protein 3 n=1 Tax=Sesamum latifolium TaxID=2727402 RepID=A0AAW2XMR6_9LAMI